MSGAPFWTASRWRRLAGSFIDGLVIAVPAGLALAVSHPAHPLLLALLDAVYTVGLTAAYGQTLGKRLVGTHVIVDGSSSMALPSVWAAAIRWFVFVGPALLLPGSLGEVAGFVLLLVAAYGVMTDERGRGIHDTLAGTRVVQLR